MFRNALEIYNIKEYFADERPKVSNRGELAGLLADFDRRHTERFGAAADHAVEIFEDVRTSYDGRWLFFEEDGARLLIGAG